MKDFLIKWILFILLALCILIWIASLIYRPWIVWANEDKFLNKFNTWITIIACINQYTYEIKQPIKWICYHWQNWQNIMIPPISHIEKWRKVFDNDRQIINRLPIINFESWFNPQAQNPFAIWYVQTLRKWNISTDIKEQLIWMKNRQESQRIWNCSHRNYSEEAMIRCLYNRHYWMLTHYNWYSNKLIITRQFYLDYFSNN